MRVWPTTVGRKLYSSSVLTLTVCASTVCTPGLVGSHWWPPRLGCYAQPCMVRSPPGGAPWFSRGLLPLSPAGCPPAGRAVTGPTTTIPTMARSTRHGRYPERCRGGRTTTSVSAAGPGTGRATPPGRRTPSIKPGAGHRTEKPRRTGKPRRPGAGAVPTGGPRPARGGAAGPRTSGAAPSSPCCSSSPGWVMSSSTARALSRRRTPWSPRSSRASSRPCRTPARR